ncbi:MAG: metal-dependent transcriptional regulator [Planctomycetota bacterium]|nr:metal-dependent transcriptional regulator [Planctomycetota bacterium]
MPSLTVENYLKAALQISMKSGSGWISTGSLAAALNVSPGTVTSMLKTLADSELAFYKPYEGVRLTDAGRKLALRVVRRHRLIELFLVETLNLKWDQVHDEAENMEHSVSDFLIDRIDDYLGHPECDPHGAPIPASDGELRGAEVEGLPLVECPTGSRVRFVRVVNQGPELLRYLSEAGFELGGEAVLRDNNIDAGIISVEVNGQALALGREAAASIRVLKLQATSQRSG